jgi:hypothetical protein
MAAKVKKLPHMAVAGIEWISGRFAANRPLTLQAPEPKGGKQAIQQEKGRKS